MSKQDRTYKDENVGDSIISQNAGWKFDNNVAENFGQHVRKSVPFYDTGHELVCELSDFFVHDNSVCYDIGTSVGELIKKLQIRNNHKSAKWIGIDNQKCMLDIAKQKCKQYKNVSFVLTDVNLFEFEKSDFIVSYYCIQFIPPKIRQELINKIYQSLNWGGAFILFEKVRGADARFQDILTSLYNEYKLKQGFTPDEILSKSKSLKGVLEPFSTQGNIDLLTRSGFVDITTILKHTCFEGFLAIK